METPGSMPPEALAHVAHQEMAKPTETEQGFKEQWARYIADRRKEGATDAELTQEMFELMGLSVDKQLQMLTAYREMMEGRTAKPPTVDSSPSATNAPSHDSGKSRGVGHPDEFGLRSN